jgi:EAL domain-containing protein (putative c-di-GMP-specific phosphodiesterase class I)
MRTRCEAIPHPGVFLEVAEGLGRVHELGQAVRRAIAKEIRTNAFRPSAVFVNLHPEELTDPDLYDPTSDLAEFASMVVLEITEREDLRGMTDVHERIAALKDLGYKIAIDDIGAGYSGLNSFVDLDPHMVKIDMGLVRGIDTCKKRQKLVSSLVALAREMDIDVVVEGVETEAERDTLIALNCDLLQGYLFSRPAAPFASPRLV